MDGRIEQGEALKPEHGEHADLPRLFWHSNKKAYGVLRRLIDRVNEWDL